MRFTCALAALLLTVPAAGAAAHHEGGDDRRHDPIESSHSRVLTCISHRRGGTNLACA